LQALIARDDIQTGKDVLTLADQMAPLEFACPVCGEVYKTEAEAIECRDQPYDDGGLMVGTIVVVPGLYYCQWPLNDSWLAFVMPPDSDNENANNHLAKGGYRVPYFVVTAIHAERGNEHQCLVTLASLCGGNLTVGWNPATGGGHYALYRIDGGKHCEGDSTWVELIEPYLSKCKPSPEMLDEAARMARLGISTRSLL
jgi:hypothetical protein